jgi:uncharacterized protein YecT (DUF1311 family)
MRIALALAFIALLAAPALGQNDKPDAIASAAIRDCIKTAGAKDGKWETCIGLVSKPCLDRDETRTTAAIIACIDREQKVWIDILSETFRRFYAKVDDKQRTKLEEMQRVWIVSRAKTCAFYWDYFQGTKASVMGASCDNREIGRRALFFLGFLNDADGK